MSIQLPVNRASTVAYAGATFEQVRGLPRDLDGLWLVVYESTVADGRVYVSTQDGIDGATCSVAAVPDRRPLTAPAAFWLGGRASLAVGVSGAGNVTMEIVRSPTVPTSERPAAGDRRQGSAACW